MIEAASRSGNAKHATASTLVGPVTGESVRIGGGFSARSFRAREVGGAMDPLVLVDHYVMTEPTFGTHPHAGMSAVSLLLDDCEGRFHNRDSLGNDFDLMPGDLYWLKAGRGAVHNESPREGSRIHGLQVFVNLPTNFRYDTPSSLLVRRQDMPVLHSSQYNVRLAMGSSNGVCGAESPAQPMTILSGDLLAGGRFEHEIATGRTAWIHAIGGDLEVATGDARTKLREGQGAAVGHSKAGSRLLCVTAQNATAARFALLEGVALEEPYVQQGPFVMGSAEELEAIKSDYENGLFGSVD